VAAVLRPRTQIDERRRAGGDEHICAQPRAALPPLTFQPDQRAEHEGGCETDRTCGERGQIESEQARIHCG